MSTGRPPIVDRLREATRALHGDAERAASVADGGIERYVWFVAKQYGFFAALEPRLAATPGLDALGLDLKGRQRAHLFAADLLHFGVSPGSLPRCAAPPRVDTVARALGVLYVTEGATLAGVFILAQVGRALGVTPSAGGAGLAPYGAALRDRWVAYADALDAWVRGAPDEEPEVLAGARDGFERMIGWLRDPAADPRASATA